LLLFVDSWFWWLLPLMVGWFLFFLN